MNFDRVEHIEHIESKLKQLESKAQMNKMGYWHKLSAYCSNMSADQLKFINSNKAVVESYKKMMDAFNLFLFEKYKEDFAQLEEVKPLCEHYINSVLNASDEYADVLIATQKENEELRKKIAELEKRQNGQNTKRA